MMADMPTDETAARHEPSRRVHCVAEEALGWLRIDNQARLNAMSLSMWKELGEGVARLAANPDVRVIVVAGSGKKAFCSGADISEFAEYGDEAQLMMAYEATGKQVVAALAKVAKPTIAMIEGFCVGGGMALALRCDLRVAADSARLGIPVAKRGLSYDFSSIKLLVDLVGPANAKHILYTGRNYDAEEALAQGLVSEVVPANDIEAHIRGLAREIAGNAPLSIAASKLIVDMTVADPQDRDLEACHAASLACLGSKDHAEATRSFMEKRSPIFTGH